MKQAGSYTKYEILIKRRQHGDWKWLKNAFTEPQAVADYEAAMLMFTFVKVDQIDTVITRKPFII